MDIWHELEHQSYMDNPPSKGQLSDSLPTFVIHTSPDHLHVSLYRSFQFEFKFRRENENITWTFLEDLIF